MSSVFLCTWSIARPLRRSSDMLARVQKSFRRRSAENDLSHATLPTGVVQKNTDILLIAVKQFGSQAAKAVQTS